MLTFLNYLVYTFFVKDSDFYIRGTWEERSAIRKSYRKMKELTIQIDITMILISLILLAFIYTLLFTPY